MSKARRSCQNLGGDLVLPLNLEEHNAIWKVAKEKKFSYPWIGLIEQQRDKFYTLDGKTPSYTNWGSSQPDSGGNENCVIFYSGDNGRWYDYTCNANSYFICQKPIRKCKKKTYNLLFKFFMCLNALP